MLSLDQIRATAKGGYLKLDGQGGLTNVGKHGGRKVVQMGEAAINRVLAKLDSQISAQDSSNHAMAARFSNPLGDHQDTEPNISSEWRQLRQGEPGKAHLPEISPNNDYWLDDVSDIPDIFT